MPKCTRLLSRVPRAVRAAPKHLAMTCALYAFLALGSSAYAAPVVFVPWSGLGLYSALLEPSTHLGRAGLSGYASAGSARQGGSSVAITGAFPLFRAPNPRSSGWGFGFAAGLNDFAYSESNILTPSYEFFEVMLGRGTTDSRVLEKSGLRGYLEFAYRSQRVHRSEKLNQVLTLLERSIDDRSHFFIVRMGAATDIGGVGLVEQKASRVGYSFHGAFYWPLVDKVPGLITLESNAEIACGSNSIRCGLTAFFAHSFAPNELADSQLLENAGFAGPKFDLRISDRASLQLKALWGVLTSHSRAVGSWAPHGEASLMIAF